MKKLKWILIVLLVIALGVGGYALYLFKFKQYDVADKNVDAVIEEGYEVTLPDGTVVQLDKDGNIVKGQGAQKQTTTTEESQTTGKAKTTPPASKTKPTVASIKDGYRASFESLESQANAKLNSLLGVAKNEYATKKATGESISVAYFYQKYTGAAAGLEASTDSAFNALYASLQKELEVNGFDSSYAQSFKDEYEAAKGARKSNLLDKIKGNL